MTFSDILNIIAIIATCVSIYSACRSNVYYKKTKILRGYTEYSKTLKEIDQILSKFRELDEFASPSYQQKRGSNINLKIRDCGLSLRASIDEINKYFPLDTFISKETYSSSNVENYIDSLTKETVIQNGIFDKCTNFQKTRNYFSELRGKIKSLENSMEEKLK